MDSESAGREYRYEGKLPWESDDQTRRNREVLVPDTIEWAGKRPSFESWLYEPIKYETAGGWTARIACRDFRKGRTLNLSSCTALATVVMPFADDAWNILEAMEGVADEYLREGCWGISRIDFARDLIVPDSQDYLRDLIVEVAQRRLFADTFNSERRIGVTFPGVAGGDRLRIYHKGLESAAKRDSLRPAIAHLDVIRVELQLRKGQLDERQRKNVAAMRSARVQPEPRETDIPVIRLKPSFDRRINRGHLRAMKRNWMPQRAVQATRDVDAFLREIGAEQLIPSVSGYQLPEPSYGFTPPK